MDHVKLLSVSEGSADIEVTLKWSNSWRNLYNNDAVYLFGKFLTKPIEGWHHIFWSEDASAHTAEEGYACEVLNGGRGLVIYRTTEGSGPSEVRLRLRWLLSGNSQYPVAASSLQSGDIPYSLQGLEMVYVPTSPFYAGDGVSSGSFSSPAFGVFPSEYDIIGTNSNFSYSGNGSESAASHANRAADRYNQGVYTSSSRHDWCGTVFRLTGLSTSRVRVAYFISVFLAYSAACIMRVLPGRGIWKVRRTIRPGMICGTEGQSTGANRRSLILFSRFCVWLVPVITVTTGSVWMRPVMLGYGTISVSRMFR